MVFIGGKRRGGSWERLALLSFNGVAWALNRHARQWFHAGRVWLVATVRRSGRGADVRRKRVEENCAQSRLEPSSSPWRNNLVTYSEYPWFPEGKQEESFRSERTELGRADHVQGMAERVGVRRYKSSTRNWSQNAINRSIMMRNAEGQM